MKLKGAVFNVFLIGSGGILAQGINAFTIPIITRLYDPSEYATWAIATSMVLVIAVLATLRYELAIVLPKDDGDAANIFSLGVIISGIVTILSYLFFINFKKPSLAFLGVNEAKVWIYWTPGLIGATGISQICNAWSTRKKKYKYLAYYSFCLVTTVAVAQISFAMLGWGDAAGLMMGTLIGNFVSAGIMLILVVCYGDMPLREVSWRRMVALAKLYRSYPFFMTPYTLVGALRERLVLFLLSIFGTPAQVGYVAFSNKIMNLPSTFFASAMRPVLYQKASTTPVPALGSVLDRVGSFLIKVSLPFWILFVCTAEEVFALCFGEKWREASKFAVLMAAPALVKLLANWLDRLFDVLGKQKLAFCLEICFSALSTGALAVGFWILKNALWAVGLQMFVLTIYYLCWRAIIYKIAEFSFSGFKKLLLTTLLLSVGSLSIWATLKTFLPFWWSFGAYLVMGGIWSLIVVGSEWRELKAP